MELVEKYLEHEEKISGIKANYDTLRTETHAEVRRLKYDVYGSKISALQDERDEKIEELFLKRDAKISEANKQIDDLHEVIAKVDRILNFLKVQKKDLTIADAEVNAYRDKHIESLGYVIDDDLLKVKLFIAENDKAKNKYSLVALGRCVFSETLCKLPHGYGTPMYESGWFSLRICLVDRPTIQELKQIMQKRRKQILTRVYGSYLEVKREYLQVLSTHHLKDFEALIKYRCDCGFFYTANETSRMSVRDGGVKCPKCAEPMKEMNAK